MKEQNIVGISVEGSMLQVVRLVSRDNELEFVGGEIHQLKKTLDAARVKEPALQDVTVDSHGHGTIDFDNNLGDETLHLGDDIGLIEDGEAEILHNIFADLDVSKINLGISVAEPEVHYAYFDTDWGLDGTELKERLVTELARVESSEVNLKPSDVHYVRLASGRIMVMFQDSSFSILEVLESACPGVLRRLTFIESAELSIVNLLHSAYVLDEEDVNLVVYVGADYSRLIFLKGCELLHISYVIGEGLDSPSIINTVYSRILLEFDKLNLTSVKHIFLCGEAEEVGLEVFLTEMFRGKIYVEYISTSGLINGIHEQQLSRFAVAVGAAMRASGGNHPSAYSLDFTPSDVKEGLKKFKLGIVGWLLLFLLPIATLFFTKQITEQREDLARTNSLITAMAGELEDLKAIENKMTVVQEELMGYEATVGILDSLPISNYRWSQFLTKLTNATVDINKIWVTDISQSLRGLSLKGFTTDRWRIPAFCEKFNGAVLNNVQIADIRGKVVYEFQIDLQH